MKILSLNLVKLRNWAGITQQQLAQSLDVGKTTINNIETGYFTAVPEKLLLKIAELFDTTVDGLLGKTPLEIGEQALLVYVVDSLDAKTSIAQKSAIVDAVFLDRKKTRGYRWLGLKIKDNALSGEGIMAGYTAIVKLDAPVRNRDIVVATVGQCDEALVRIYQKQGDIITLKAKNDTGLYKDIVIDTKKDSFKLIGKVEKCEFKL